ncbi:alpha/beta hydrolase [Cupriavidus basilensis]|uniref:Alpha/beta fold hydrolase n=1 Tax=Cupriavidus basilensis TaxID=68895 RepID=A0A643FNI2_9BURK|nr:alpha/beta fold hydrolase [Cupriavidus basilensis]QOT79565.1 alpha/beta fold hydrolase [Cupriavidus basilensis]
MSSLPPSGNRIWLDGAAGSIEALTDAPQGPIRAIAVVAHPHPLLGGSAEHKIPVALARIFQARGFLAVRPNFRGVGGTQGSHDAGEGETDDVLAVVRQVQAAHPGLPLALAGFSFGAYVQTRVAQRLAQSGEPVAHLILAGMPAGPAAGGRTYDTPAVPADAFVIHGENDANVPLQAVFDWARPQELPVVVVPGANHFFTGKLPVFQRAVAEYLDTRQRIAGAAS